MSIEILLLALDKVLKMIFVKSIFVLLMTDFLLTGKGFGMLRTCKLAAITPNIFQFLLTLYFSPVSILI